MNARSFGFGLCFIVSMLAGLAFTTAGDLKAADSSAIIALVKKAVAPTKVTVGPIAVENSYAIADWLGNDGHEGGQALLVNHTRWSIISSGGGCLANVRYLKSRGVPGPTAKALVTDLGGKYSC